MVTRIFERAAKGIGYRSIAAELNKDGIAAPHDGGRGNKKFKGWGHTTIRHMLLNPEYVGSDSWGAYRWTLLDDGTYEKSVQEDPDKRVSCPVPAIISKDLWARVQTRFSRNGARAKREHFGGGKHRGWLFSGLAKCGVCGGSLTIASRRYKAGGEHYANLGCRTWDATGGTGCTNNRTISEKKVVDAATAELRRRLQSPEMVEEFTRAAKQRFQRLGRKDSQAAADLNRRVHECRSRIAKLTEALARTGYSEAVGKKLAEEEAALADAESRARMVQREAGAVVLPHPASIQKEIDGLLMLLEGEDLVKARSALAKHMPPLVVTPIDGGWEITGGFDMATFVGVVSVEEVGGTGIEPATRRV